MKIQSQPSNTEQKVPQSLPVLPSIEIQTLQAELSLQKLSKEVVHLRNQQRESLKARRLEVLEKKKRAQARRESYLQEMNQLQSQLREALNLNERYRETIEINQQTITILEGKVELLSNQNKDLNDQVLSLQNELAESRNIFQHLQGEKAREEENHQSEKVKWMNERETLRKEKMSCELQIEVLTKSNEKSEER